MDGVTIQSAPQLQCTVPEGEPPSGGTGTLGTVDCAYKNMNDSSRRPRYNIRCHCDVLSQGTCVFDDTLILEAGILVQLFCHTGFEKNG